MSDQVLFWILVAGMVAALALGIWVGLGYPGLYEKYESTGTKAPRRSPFEMLVDWLVERFDRR